RRRNANEKEIARDPGALSWRGCSSRGRMFESAARRNHPRQSRSGAHDCMCSGRSILEIPWHSEAAVIKLTENFRLVEFRAPLVPESEPAEMERVELPRMANVLQWIRDLVGPRNDPRAAGIVKSWYRSPEHNADVSETGTTGPHTTGHG